MAWERSPSGAARAARGGGCGGTPGSSERWRSDVQRGPRRVDPRHRRAGAGAGPAGGPGGRGAVNGCVKNEAQRVQGAAAVGPDHARRRAAGSCRELCAEPPEVRRLRGRWGQEAMEGERGRARKIERGKTQKAGVAGMAGVCVTVCGGCVGRGGCDGGQGTTRGRGRVSAPGLGGAGRAGRAAESLRRSLRGVFGRPGRR